MRRWLLLVNPVAGKKVMQTALCDVLSVFSAANIATTVVITTHKGHATAYTSAHASEYDRIVCAGGDGTLNECITGLLSGGHRVPLGYIPCGSTNDFAKSHHIPTNPVLAAKKLLCATPTPIDIGELNGRYFIYIASFGAFTAASYDAPQQLKNTLGHAAYLLEAVRELPTAIVPIRATVTTAKRVFRGAFVFGALSNTCSIGGVFKLPQKIVGHDDGLFELTLIRYPEHLTDYAAIVKNALCLDFSDRRLRMLHTNRVRIAFEKPVDFTLDGEQLAHIEEATLSVHHGAVLLCN